MSADRGAAGQTIGTGVMAPRCEKCSPLLAPMGKVPRWVVEEPKVVEGQRRSLAAAPAAVASGPRLRRPASWQEPWPTRDHVPWSNLNGHLDRDFLQTRMERRVSVQPTHLSEASARRGVQGEGAGAVFGGFDNQTLLLQLPGSAQQLLYKQGIVSIVPKANG